MTDAFNMVDGCLHSDLMASILGINSVTNMEMFETSTFAVLTRSSIIIGI